MVIGLIKKKVSFRDTICLWVICYLGNWLGSIVLAVIYHFSGIGFSVIGDFIAASAYAKMTIDFIPLVMRGILCNILVCLATWCGIRCKSESGRLIMIFWCLFAFITSGYEHSIANMTLLTVSLMNKAGQAITIGGYFYNILSVTLGNMIGGILFVAVPYYLVSRK